VLGVMVLGACHDPAAKPDAGPSDAASDAGLVQLAPAPTEIAFDGVITGCHGLPSMVGVSNTGTTTSGLLGTGVMGTNASDFAILADGCAGHSLAPAASCTIAMQFAPSFQGGKSANLVITAPTAETMVNVSGSGFSAQPFAVNPGHYDFGVVAPGTTSPVATFTFLDGWLCGIGTISVSPMDGADPTQFAIASDQCSGTQIGPTTPCTIGVVYMPTAAGPKTAHFDVSTSPGGVLHVALSGL